MSNKLVILWEDPAIALLRISTTKREYFENYESLRRHLRTLITEKIKDLDPVHFPIELAAHVTTTFLILFKMDIRQGILLTCPQAFMQETIEFLNIEFKEWKFSKLITPGTTNPYIYVDEK